ncbi:unnamed protein product [Closterium sp. NIES-65]|nr:unnamed protein product [Closterium sp. NIES-65]
MEIRRKLCLLFIGNHESLVLCPLPSRYLRASLSFSPVDLSFSPPSRRPCSPLPSRRPLFLSPSRSPSCRLRAHCPVACLLSFPSPVRSRSRRLSAPLPSPSRSPSRRLRTLPPVACPLSLPSPVRSPSRRLSALPPVAFALSLPSPVRPSLPSPSRSPSRRLSALPSRRLRTLPPIAFALSLRRLFALILNRPSSPSYHPLRRRHAHLKSPTRRPYRRNRPRDLLTHPVAIPLPQPVLSRCPSSLPSPVRYPVASSLSRRPSSLSLPFLSPVALPLPSPFFSLLPLPSRLIAIAFPTHSRHPPSRLS